MRALLVLGCLIGWLVPAWAADSTRAHADPATSARAARIKAELRSILSSPQYRVEKPSESALDRLLQQIGDGLKAVGRWLGRFFRFGGALGGGGGSLFFWVVLAGLIVGMAYVTAYALRRAGTRKAADPDPRKSGVTDEPEEGGATAPDEWLAAAKRLAAAGDYRRAYRAVFVAMLLRLDRMGAIRFERSRTNGEYLRELRSRQSVYRFMNPLARDFDSRWYGGASVAKADYERFLRAFENIPASS